MRQSLRLFTYVAAVLRFGAGAETAVISETWDSECVADEFRDWREPPLSRKPLGGIDKLLVDAPRYATVALSVPWLRTYVEGNSQVRAEMRYVNGRSISPKAMERLREDLKGRGRENLLRAVSEHLAESVFLEVKDQPGCWSRIIVLPNGDTILWQFQCSSPLQYPAASFKSWDCYGWRFTGTLIAADGKFRN